MKLRSLALDDRAKAAVQRVREFAEKPENWYLIGAGGRACAPVPGDNPRYRVLLGSYRCVFTWTRQADGQVFRHLSISVPSADYPSPVAAFEIAVLFGFTGYDSMMEREKHGLSGENVNLNTIAQRAAEAGWIFHPNRDEHCIVIAQKIPPENRWPSPSGPAGFDTPVV